MIELVILMASRKAIAMATLLVMALALLVVLVIVLVIQWLVQVRGGKKSETMLGWPAVNRFCQIHSTFDHTTLVISYNTCFGR